MSGEREISQERRERIERRAYELYLERGDSRGSDLEDWLAAEREVLGRQDNNPQLSSASEAGQKTALHNENAAPTTNAATESQAGNRIKKANKAAAGGKSNS
jgi:hypothetical protein